MLPTSLLGSVTPGRMATMGLRALRVWRQGQKAPYQIVMPMVMLGFLEQASSLPLRRLPRRRWNVLITGMSQLQQVLLKQKTEVIDVEDKAVTELMKLPEYTAETGAIDFQDYLYLTEQQIATLAAGASDWWAQTLRVAQSAYAEYLTLIKPSEAVKRQCCVDSRAARPQVSEAGAQGRVTGAGITPKGGEGRPHRLPCAGGSPDFIPSDGDLSAGWGSGPSPAVEAA